MSSNLEKNGDSDKGQKKQKKKEKKVKTTNPKDVQIDMNCRDPNDLNSHIRTGFEEVIGEPDGAHSAPVVWTNVNKAFQIGNSCCFACLTYVCAIPLVFLWGCNFACISFLHIYSITPCFRIFLINCDCVSKFFSATIHCLCDPLYEAVALTFTKIFVNVRQNVDPFEERTYRGINTFSSKQRKLTKTGSMRSNIRRNHVTEHESQQLHTYDNTDGFESDNEVYEDV